MNKKIDVLDHGYVEFIEAWGTGKAGTFGSIVKWGDELEYAPTYHDIDIEKEISNLISLEISKQTDYEVGIIEAARQSTQKAFVSWEPYEDYPKGDKGLLSYLYNNRHDTPFEFSGMVIEVQAPIFVFREWHRHRTQSYNEMSARYAPLPDLYYLPTADEVYDRALQAYITNNKQEAGAVKYEPQLQEIIDWLEEQERQYRQFEAHYQRGLSIGIPKEIARIGMPVGHYSRMRASANLRNWLAFIKLRADKKAQKEIREYAFVVTDLLRDTFPQTMQLFDGVK